MHFSITGSLLVRAPSCRSLALFRPLERLESFTFFRPAQHHDVVIRFPVVKSLRAYTWKT